MIMEELGQEENRDYGGKEGFGGLREVAKMEVAKMEGLMRDMVVSSRCFEKSLDMTNGNVLGLKVLLESLIGRSGSNYSKLDQILLVVEELGLAATAGSSIKEQAVLERALKLEKEYSGSLLEKLERYEGAVGSLKSLNDAVAGRQVALARLEKDNEYMVKELRKRTEELRLLEASVHQFKEQLVDTKLQKFKAIDDFLAYTLIAEKIKNKTGDCNETLQDFSPNMVHGKASHKQELRKRRVVSFDDSKLIAEKLRNSNI